MSKRKWVFDLIKGIVKDEPTANMVLDVLVEEGVLNLDYGDDNIGRVVTSFTETFGTTKTSKYDRFAAKRLSDRYGVQAVTGVITLLGRKRDEPYAPVVGNIKQLEDKWVSVLNFLRKNDDIQEVDVV